MADADLKFGDAQEDGGKGSFIKKSEEKLKRGKKERFRGKVEEGRKGNGFREEKRGAGGQRQGRFGSWGGGRRTETIGRARLVRAKKNAGTCTAYFEAKGSRIGSSENG